MGLAVELRIHASVVIAAGAVFIPVDALMVALRVYARRLQHASLGPDDWSIIGALVFVIGLCIGLVVEVAQKRLGYAEAESSIVVGEDANIAFWPLEILQIPALGLIKLSFLFFYRRIFRSGRTLFSYLSSLMIGIIIAWTVSFFFSAIFICRTDFSAYWRSTQVEKAECVNTNTFHNALSISDAVLDILIIIFPIPSIWKLQMSNGRKVAVTAIFFLGIITVAMSLVRMVIFLQATSVQYDPNIDFEYVCTNGIYWSVLEAGLGIIAACLPSHYYFLGRKDVQEMVRSARSAISLESLRSQSSRSKKSDHAKKTENGQEGDHLPAKSTPSNNIVGRTSLESEAQPGSKGITVTRSFEHQVQHV